MVDSPIASQYVEQMRRGELTSREMLRKSLAAYEAELKEADLRAEVSRLKAGEKISSLEDTYCR